MIILRKEDIEVLENHAAREYPNECCGVIIGDLSDPEKNEVRPCLNIQHELKEKYPDQYARDADTGYFMNPKQLIRALNDANGRRLSVIGFYHSHPDHEAYWSSEDHRAAMWADEGKPSYPDACHIVISVINGAVKDMAMFAWDPAKNSFLRLEPDK